MAWLGTRALLVAAASTAAVLGLGVAARRAAQDAVGRAREAIIDSAALEARRRITAEARALADAALRRFAWSSAIKAALAASLAALAAAGILSGPLFASLLAAVLIGAFLRDLALASPGLRLSLQALSAHGWRARTALSEVVAAEVMAETLKRAEQTPVDWRGRVALAVAGADATAVGRQVAEAVYEVARETTWRDIRPIVLATALKIVAGLILYGLFVAMIAHVAGA